MGKGRQKNFGAEFVGAQRRKPPLCKGRWHGAAVTEGLMAQIMPKFHLAWRRGVDFAGCHPPVTLRRRRRDEIITFCRQPLSQPCGCQPLAAARSRRGSDMPPAYHSLPRRHFVTPYTGEPVGRGKKDTPAGVSFGVWGVICRSTFCTSGRCRRGRGHCGRASFYRPSWGFF